MYDDGNKALLTRADIWKRTFEPRESHEKLIYGRTEADIKVSRGASEHVVHCEQYMMDIEEIGPLSIKLASGTTVTRNRRGYIHKHMDAIKPSLCRANLI